MSQDTYYQADVYTSQDFYDEDKYIEYGKTSTIREPSLEALIKTIESRYFSLTKPIGADVQIFDNAIEMCYEWEHPISSEPQPLCQEITRFIISRVETITLDLATEPLFAGVSR